MKAILISIRPQWVAKILNGEKTIEIRKTFPKCNLPIDVYIYCTKDSKFPLVIGVDGLGTKEYCNGKHYPPFIVSDVLNGKVVAKFTLNTIWRYENKKPVAFRGENKMILYQYDDLQVFGCVSLEEINQYCNGDCYTWHIDNLVIFDKPKELWEYKREIGRDDEVIAYKNITKAPQSYCYIEKP